jgi:invasion protein IalB
MKVTEMSMISMRLGAVILAQVLMLGSAVAQDAAATPPAPPTKDTATLGQMYVASTSAPWETRCTKTDGAVDPCELFQLLRDESGGAVAEFAMFAIPEGEVVAGATVMAPLETLLETGLILSVDGAEPKGYPFAFCTSYGCVARVGLTKDELAAMKAGSEAVLTIVPAAAPDVKVALKLSLKGFTAGFDAVAETAQKK